MEILEPVAVPGPPTDHDSSCPFCNQEDPEEAKSKIGKDNDAKELENNLAGLGQPRSDLDFCFPDYGNYSGEPHHLVSGNEALKGHPIENWLSTESKSCQVKADTGFDVNHARNGVWLPSITDENRICKWITVNVKIKGKVKKKRRPAPGEEGKKMWSSLSVAEKDQIAFAIMGKEKLQFHKGNHRNKGATPSECYIKEAKRLLTEILSFVHGSLKVKCPEAKKDKNSKYPPPGGLNNMIYAMASGHMRWHVNGPPESWFVFISPLARRFYQQAIDEGASPWEAPYEGHPDH